MESSLDSQETDNTIKHLFNFKKRGKTTLSVHECMGSIAAVFGRQWTFKSSSAGFF
eukprot:GDKH01015271.1.p1 GENE.GDKH01015271.1~~GDKH01015271.1.p1  ORF type:complete len:56 (-),score=2.91 GDKH01015271.1:4-171(-)